MNRFTVVQLGQNHLSAKFVSYKKPYPRHSKTSKWCHQKSFIFHFKFCQAFNWILVTELILKFFKCLSKM